jgi:hypothetical protein
MPGCIGWQQVAKEMGDRGGIAPRSPINEVAESG